MTINLNQLLFELILDQCYEAVAPNFDTITMCSFRYESCIDVEIQQRAVEYFALSRKGAALVDILAEMPKFPERQVLSKLIALFYSTY